MQTLSALTRPPDSVEGDIKVTSIDARQLASGQVIHIPAQSTQPAVQPITIAGIYTLHYITLHDYIITLFCLFIFIYIYKKIINILIYINYIL